MARVGVAPPVMLLFALAAWAPPASAPQAARGWPLYARLCLACHGKAGDGHGPAAPYAWPAPRPFTRGELKWRSTPVGQPPTEDDVRATILLGAPGTSMPGFAGTLTSAQLDDVIEVVRAFAPAAWDGVARPIVLGPPPPPDPVRGAALWLAKGCPACHGADADGHGPSSFALRAPPYDLRTVLHRPREPGPDAYRAAAAQSIATGLTGTAMPTFAGTLAETDLWALADHVVAIAGGPTGHDRRAMQPRTIEADRKAPIQTGTWPGLGDSDDVAVFGEPIAPQGPPPASLAPAQASLAAQQCARCHAKQAREWQPSLHRGAASPGVLAQTEYGMAHDERAACLRCHAPLAEQADDATLRGDGVSCAGCHVRGWVRRGPPGVSPALLPLPGYPLATAGIYERADFCLPCHQLPPRTAVAGRPLLDTYREWLDGPYLPRGVQCQHCHMPEREHAVLGIHDPGTFRQGIALTASAHRRGAAITAIATLANVGAGHFLPTTPTPAVWLAIALVDARGRPIAGASDRRRIGRDVVFDGAWHQRADTRIPPGEATTLARAWAAGRTADAAFARFTVEVHPDEFYERFYADKLARPLAPAQRALYEQALARARGSHYLAEQRDVPISPDPAATRPTVPTGTPPAGPGPW
ncbi:MAG TPA: c-type cytochrome [Kofleriaceae bacterium]|nr:c-type cytochrome [Kofleriaceae bacterium]